MKSKTITALLCFLCACCLVVGLTACSNSSDGGMLGPPEDTVGIEDVSDDAGGDDDGGDDGDGDDGDEATDDETTP